ncbi:MAG: hypothetical protein MUF01_14825 [Bryobacterales bacterium]|nr:hypothetical protein [Bryobacterales bacterium]
MLARPAYTGARRPHFRVLAFCSVAVNALLLAVMLALFWYLDGQSWDNFRLLFESLAVLFVGGVSLAMCVEWGWRR